MGQGPTGPIPDFQPDPLSDSTRLSTGGAGSTHRGNGPRRRFAEAKQLRPQTSKGEDPDHPSKIPKGTYSVECDP